MPSLTDKPAPGKGSIERGEHRDDLRPQPQKVDPVMADALTAVVVPAMLESVRLPNKPLLDRSGKPLVAYTLGNALASQRVTDVGLITNRSAVHKAAFRSTRGVGLLAHTSHKEASCGSHRIGHWLDHFQGWDVYHVVVNLQCDEPCIDPRDLDNLIAACHVSDEICTLVTPLEPRERQNPNVVKAWRLGGVVRDFSRHMHSSYEPSSGYRHLGAYAIPQRYYRSCFRGRRSPRSQSAALEQLTWLDAGLKVLAVDLKFSGTPISVRTKEDYRQFCQHVRAHEKLR